MASRYVSLYSPGHPKANNKGYVNAHVLMAEIALGKPLPVGAVVHHVDDKERTVVTRRLVICQNQAYHRLIHKRQRALLKCGNANWLVCRVCKAHDDPSRLVIYPRTSHGIDNRTIIQHRECKQRFEREYAKKSKEDKRAN